jgi:hypothetical protein
LALALLILLLLAWPYVTVWRLSETIRTAPPAALASWVDLDSVREQILRRLNKDTDSTIEAVSDPFIEWIEQGLREPGNARLERSVTLDWVHGLLHVRASADGGLVPHLAYAFYDPPDRFRVRVEHPPLAPLTFWLQLGPTGWRIAALSY